MPRRKPKLVEEIRFTGSEQSRTELRLRRQMRAGKIKPTPRGIIVTGRLGEWAAPHQAHLGHLFVTRKPIKNPLWRSGYQQGALCMVCDEELPPIDACWWLDFPSDDRIRLTMDLIKEEAQRLHEVWFYLKGTLP